MTATPDIRQATESDVTALLPMVREYWRFEAIEGFDAAGIERLLRRVIADATLGHVWLAKVDGVAAGYLLAVYVFSLEHQGLTAEIDELFVVAENRGLGIGAQLLAAAEHTFRMRGCTNVSLQIGRDNDEARAFYCSHGYAGRDDFELVHKHLT
jgi:GNAT superfamily N-acetyltransferase